MRLWIVYTVGRPATLVLPAGGGQPGDGRGRVPVVGVDHVGTPAQGGDGQVERRPAEEGKAIGVIPT